MALPQTSCSPGIDWSRFTSELRRRLDIGRPQVFCGIACGGCGNNRLSRLAGCGYDHGAILLQVPPDHARRCRQVARRSSSRPSSSWPAAGAAGQPLVTKPPPHEEHVRPGSPCVAFARRRHDVRIGPHFTPTRQYDSRRAPRPAVAYGLDVADYAVSALASSRRA
jgi:hypothetical protein